MTITRSQRFWNWFRGQENKYRSFLYCSDQEIEDLLHEFDVHLRAYCRHLDAIFEKGKDGSIGKLIITANCRARSFSMAVRLVANAPEMRHWVVQALDEPRAVDFRMEEDFPDVRIDAGRLWFAPLGKETDGKPDIVVYSKLYKYESGERFEKAVRRVVYNVLGERSYAMDIGEVYCEYLPGLRIKKGLRPLEELPGYLGKGVSRQLAVGS